MNLILGTLTAAALIGCGGSENCDGEVVFVSDTFEFPSAEGQICKDLRVEPRNTQDICGARYSATGLPDGVSIHDRTGVISGRPTTAQQGRAVVRLTAGDGTVERTFGYIIYPDPLAPNGWTFKNPNPRMPLAGATYTAPLGGALYSMVWRANSTDTFSFLKSTDGGQHWTSVTTAPEIMLRTARPIAAHDGSALYVTDFDYPSWVTYRFNGTTWTRTVATTGPSGRANFSLVANSNGLFLIGGISGNVSMGIDWTVGGRVRQPSTGATYLNEVWRSVDGGANWTRVTTTTPFTARAGHCSVSMDNQLYLFGGYNASTVFSDLWRSTDGENWTQVGTAARPWSDQARYETCTAHGSTLAVAFNNRYGHFDLNNGTWTTDGSLPWADLYDSPSSYSGGFPRALPGFTSFGGSLVLVGGVLVDWNGRKLGLNDVWAK